MPAQVDMATRTPKAWGSRTTITAAQLAAQSNNEAIQFNIIYIPFRRKLLRMAPWACAFISANLNFITSVPITPVNTSVATQLWAKDQPPPSYAYVYQYLIDCLRMCWLTSQTL